MNGLNNYSLYVEIDNNERGYFYTIWNGAGEIFGQSYTKIGKTEYKSLRQSPDEFNQTELFYVKMILKLKKNKKFIQFVVNNKKMDKMKDVSCDKTYYQCVSVYYGMIGCVLETLE